MKSTDLAPTIEYADFLVTSPKRYREAQGRLKVILEGMAGGKKTAGEPEAFGVRKWFSVLSSGECGPLSDKREKGFKNHRVFVAVRRQRFHL